MSYHRDDHIPDHKWVRKCAVCGDHFPQIQWRQILCQDCEFESETEEGEDDSKQTH